MIHSIRFFIAFVFTALTLLSQAQTIVFQEGFENATIQFTSSTTSGSTANWGLSNRFQKNGIYSDTARSVLNDTLILTSDTFSTSGFVHVSLSFEHICDIFSADSGFVEVTNNAGRTWYVISRQEYYTGPHILNGGPIWGVKQAFNETMYPALWGGLIPSLVIGNNWWKREEFDLTSFIGFSGTDNTSDSCQIRFKLANGGGVPPFPGTTNGWFLDSVQIVASICEIQKPTGNFLPPVIANNSTVFSLGPYNLAAKFKDVQSGMDTAYLFYAVNNGAWDSVGMTPMSPAPNDTIWNGAIPKLYNGVDTIAGGDSICYYMIGYDTCLNALKLPAPPSLDTCLKFYVNGSKSLPYCDDFETSTDWSDSTITPTTLDVWQKGDPSTIGGYSAYSGTQSWITGPFGNYISNSEGYLYSPYIDFSNAKSARVSFMQKRDMPEDADRISLEFQINGGTFVTLGVHQDSAGILPHTPNCPSTWNTTLGSAAVSNGWNGNTGDWIKSFYQLDDSLNNLNGAVRFRFKFESDNFGTDFGVSIDDFCVENPLSTDAGVVHIISPGSFADSELNFLKVAGNQDSVTIVIRNLGSDTITSLPISYSVDSTAGLGGSILVNEVYDFAASSTKFPNGLPVLEMDTLTFNTTFQVPQGHFTVTTYTGLSGDLDLNNDTTVSLGHFGFITSVLPVEGSIENNFDSAEAIWSTLPLLREACDTTPVLSGSRWERGTPNFGATSSSYSSPNAWDINLDTAYGRDADEFLYTQFFDLSNSNQAYVSLWYNINTFSVDGFRLEFRVSDTATIWQMLSPLGGPPFPREENWFTGNSVQGGLFGWTGNSNGWVYAQYPINPMIPPAADQVQFRFRFLSDMFSSSNEEGVSIDNFRIVNPETNDIELVDFILPIDACLKSSNETVKVSVRNAGKLAIDSIPVCFEYTNPSTPLVTIGPICDTIYQTLQAGEEIEFEFDSTIDMTSFGNYEFNAWSDYALDSNLVNDTIKGHIVENKNGCDVKVTLTTNSFIPSGMNWFIIDTLNNDTVVQVPFSSIGTSVNLWTQNFCLPSNGKYIFATTPNLSIYISFAELRDLYADTAVLTLSAPTASGGVGFNWECPPLFNAATERIEPIGNLTTFPILQTYDIKSTIANLGALNYDTVTINLQINRKFPTPGLIVSVTDTISFNSGGIGIPTFAKEDYTFLNAWNANQPGEYEISIWTKEPNFNTDTFVSDDTTYLSYVILDTVQSLASPYCNNFDLGTQNPWGSYNQVYYPSPTFERGSPSQANINAANSTPNSWMTGLSSNHGDDENSALYSPLFTIDDTSVCYKISFSHHYKSEYTFDGGVLEYSIDSGATWTTFGALLDSLSASNWYNSPFIVGLNGSPPPPGWSGNSNGYVSSFHDIHFPDFGKSSFNVVFRFRFGSDASVNDEGWSIDDFCFEKGGNCIFSSCFDSILNGDETGIDCGGTLCDPCHTCTDGILNGFETGIDCGGPECPVCPNCSDGIMNGQEMGIDCGGPDCPICPSCTDGILNGLETGIDCGGPECPPCWVGIDKLNLRLFQVGQNIPNPTNGKTFIPYVVPNAGKVVISFRNLIGQQIEIIHTNAVNGMNQIEIDVADWAMGIYYYTFEYDDQKIIRKMTISK